MESRRFESDSSKSVYNIVITVNKFGVGASLVSNRFADWFRQAEADLAHARNALKDGDYEWSCFAAQQAAEKALKAAFQRYGADAWGHTLSALIGSLPAEVEPASPQLVDYARMLDKHYIPTRYPNGFASGAPTDFYTATEARDAISYAEAIIGYCHHQISQP
jgi:HEPN domain-containing protein